MSSIESQVRERDQLAHNIQQDTLEYDRIQRKLRARAVLLDEKDAFLRERQSRVRAVLPDSDPGDSEAAQERYRITHDIESLKRRLARTQTELATALTESQRVVLSPESPRLRSRIAFLQRTVRDRKHRLAQLESQRQTVGRELMDVGHRGKQLAEIRKTLQEKETALTERHQKAFRVLSESTDRLTHEEIVVSGLEAEVASLGSSRPVLRDEPSDADVQALVAANQKRRIVLENRRERLEDRRFALEHRNPGAVTRYSPTHGWIRTRELAPDRMQSHVEETADRFAKRQMALSREEDAIQQLTDEYTAIRKRISGKWNQKMEKSRGLSDELRENIGLVHAVREQSEGIENGRQQSFDLRRRIGQIQTLERDKARYQESLVANEQTRAALRRRGEELETVDEELKERRSRIEGEKGPMGRLEWELNEKEGRVITIESEAKEVGSTVEGTLKRVHAEEARMMELLQSVSFNESELVADL